MRRMHLRLYGSRTMCGRGQAEHYTDDAAAFLGHEPGDRCAVCERALSADGERLLHEEKASQS